MLTIPNIITFGRILLSAALLFLPALSPSFYAVYIAAGLTDMLDGFIARKTGTATEFGARLDTSADFILVAVCLIRLIPIFDLQNWLLIWTAVIALIKVINIVSGLVMRKRFVALHTFMNKLTGVLLFILPLTLKWIDLKYSGAAVCIAATFAAVQEGHYIRTGCRHSRCGAQ